MRTSLIEEPATEKIKREELLREKAQTAALKALEQFQNDGLMEKEVLLAAYWLELFAKEAVELNRSKTPFALPEL